MIDCHSLIGKLMPCPLKRRFPRATFTFIEGGSGGEEEEEEEEFLGTLVPHGGQGSYCSQLKN